MKRLPVLLLLLIITSCAGTPKETGQKTAAGNITQQSVVEDELSSSMRFKEFKELRTPGPVIPGLLQNAVPQGMAYWKDENIMLISAYMSDNTAGVIIALDMDNGSLHKAVTLYNFDRTPHTGHLGGLALGKEHLWIASGPGVYPVELQTIKNTEDGGRIILPEIIATETKASFATYHNEILWVGEFTRADGSYPAAKTHGGKDRTGKAHHGWMAGYHIDMSSDDIPLKTGKNEKILPDYILAIPEEIQGAVFEGDSIILSASYGRKNDSRLLIYNSPLAETHPHSQVKFSDYIIPLWYLDGINKTLEIKLPPMSEAAVLYENSIALLFESAAAKYRDTSSFPLDRIQYIQLFSNGKLYQ